MELWHVPDTGTSRRIANDVEVASTAIEQTRGLMFRGDFPEGSALVFPFDTVKRRVVHTLFVRFPIYVIWLNDGDVVDHGRMRPWFDIGWSTADTLIELPSEPDPTVTVGDRIEVRERIETSADGSEE